jgi:TolB-like protein
MRLWHGAAANTPIGARAPHNAATITEEVRAALLRAVGSLSPRYQLRGRVRDDGDQRLRVMLMLTATATGRHLWADRWLGSGAACP